MNEIEDLGRARPSNSANPCEAPVRSQESPPPKELFWVQRLEQYAPLTLPFVQSPNVPATARWRNSEWQMPVGLNGLAPKVCVHHVLAAWISYLARITGEPHYQIGWVSAQTGLKEASVSTFLSPVVPMSVSIDLDWDLVKIRRHVSREYRHLARNYTFYRDAILRDPTLRGNRRQFSTQPWQVATFVGESDPDEGTSISAFVEVLAFQIRPSDGQYRWIYDQNKLGTSEIHRIASHLEKLVSASIDAVSCRSPVRMLPILPPQERELLLETWNRTEADYPSDLCVHQLFEAQV
ncbi:hypothetical protein, partial [Rhizobium rhizogenes]